MSTTDTSRSHRVTLPVADGRFEAHVAEPAMAATAGVILLHEIFGITDRIHRYAADYAAQGLRVIVPDLFWRIEPGVALGHDAADLKRAMQRLKQFDDEGALRDVAACAGWLRQQDAALPVTMIGYCLGGKLVVKSRQQGLADRYVTYYGIGVEHLDGDLAGNNAPLQLHYGTQDDYAPEHVVRGFAPRLGSRAELHLYDGVGHAFYRPGRDAASDQSRRRTLAFLSQDTPAATKG